MSEPSYARPGAPNNGSRMSNPEELEQVVAFRADIPKFAFDIKGNLVIHLRVVPEDKWAALPLTDIRGRRFTFQAFTAPARAKKLKEAMERPRP